MKELVGPHIASLQPYVPGKPIEEVRRERGLTGEILKMASNENPLGPSPKAVAAARIALMEGHLYPDGGAFYLRERLARHHDVPMERVLVGNGSNELLEIVVRTFCQPGDHVVTSKYAFIVYKLAAQACNVEATEVPMGEDLRFDLPALADAIGPRTRAVFIANPNNPTGTYVTRAELTAFLQSASIQEFRPLVVMDEAYIEYADAGDYPDSLELHGLYDRLVSMRTFSKCYGLAALRIGYCISSAEVIGYMNRVRAPFNANRVGQVAALAALDDVEFVRSSVAVNRSGRVQIMQGLDELGVSAWPSQANFVLCRLPRRGVEVYEELLDRGVIVRPMAGYGLAECVRISVGTPQQNLKMLSALRAVLAADDHAPR